MAFRGFFHFILICSIFANSSCLKVKEIPLPESSPIIVVNGLFNPDSLWKVNISTSANTTKESDFFLPYVGNAEVELWEADTLLGKMIYAGSGNYLLPTYPQVNTLYRLQVSVPGFDTLFAESRIPVYPTQMAANWDLSTKVNQTDRFGGVFDAFGLSFNFVDPVLEDNFYLFGTAYYDSCSCTYPVLGGEDTLVIDPFDDLLKSGGLYSNISDATYSDLQRLLLSDETFNGIERELNVFTPDTAELFYGIFMDVPPRSDSDSLRIENVFLNERLYVEIFADSWSLSEDLYLYLSSYFLQGTQTANPFANYSNVYSNVEGGTGIFAGYQRRLIPIYPQ
jgi:hypothetical protein